MSSTPARRLLRFQICALVVILGVPGAATAQSTASAVPTPEEVIGFAPGTDYRLDDYSQIEAYFRALDAASERVLLREFGQSSLGRPMLVAIISDPDNLAELEAHRAASAALARARISEDEARALARDGKVVVWIDSGLHATEVAHGQHSPVLAHWLATDESDEARRARRDAITLVVANMNPDGLDIVANWYRSMVGTPFEVSSVPELYHHYIGHDNNRDWYMFTQVEHQAVARLLYHQWYPQLVYNHHQTSPFPGRIWMPPVEDPINPNIDPLVVTSLNLVGEAMKRRFSQEDKPGALSGVIFDGWWSGYMSDAVNYHNMVGFITETALYRYATPHCYEDDEIPDTFGAASDNLPTRSPSIAYPDPWLGGCWHIGDAIDYMMTANKAVLDLAVKHREEWLLNIWRMGRRQIEKMQNAEAGGYAYLVDPSAQADPGRAIEMLQALFRGGIEVHRADAPFRAGDTEYPAGTYVMPPQPFRPFLVDLMEPKDYPDLRQYPGGPPDPPYDMTGYELPLVMGVDVARVDEPFEVPERAIAGVDEIRYDGGGVGGAGSDAFVLRGTSNLDARAANRLLRDGAEVGWSAEPLRVDGEDWPAGALVVSGVTRDRVQALGAELGLAFAGVEAAPGATIELRRPRIGLYRSWVANMPEGWTRWLLEQYEFDFVNIRDDQIRAGELGELDAIILPDQGAQQILHGHLAETMPAEYTGGLGLEGALQLQRFVERGGWLIAIDQAVDFAIDQFGLPLRNRVRSTRSQEFFIPGSLINLSVDTTDPLGFGLDEAAIAFFVNSQVLEIVDAAGEGDNEIERDLTAYAHYAEDDWLASGWVLGGDSYLAGGVAAARVPLGDGQVILLGFEPHYRAQSHNTYKLLFNPLFASTTDADLWRR